MTGLPPGYSVRPGSLDDVPEVAALEAAYDTAVLGAPYMDDAWVREDWTRERFDPAVDSWLVSTTDGTLAAYGHTCDEEGDGNLEAIVRVHPDHWGRGLGSALIGLTERRAEEYPATASGVKRLLNVTTARDTAAAALLHAHGYALERHFWHMELDLTGALPEVDPPDGTSIRGFERAVDTAAVHEVLQVAFENHYLFTPRSLVEWVKELEKESFEEGLWLVATEGRRVVAALTGRRMLGEGWVSELGVLPEWRGRGIGAALLAEIFRIFKEHGFQTAVLNVDAANATGATALYERVGMRVRLAWDLYAKTLRG